MRTNHVKAKLQNGEACIGLWLNFNSTNTARILAHAGLDWLLIDFEHSAGNPTLVADMITVVADAGGSAPLVRVPTNSVEYYKWVLDSGAWGVMVPMVNTREEAEFAVSCCKYPPTGTRSIGGAYSAYAFKTTRADYYRLANDHIMTIVQIESKTAVENIDEILSVPGIDVAFIGPNDLCASLGVTPFSESQDPVFLEALEKIKAAGKRHNVPLGIFGSDGNAVAMRIAEGFRFINIGSEISALLDGVARNLKISLLQE
jgi:4-hydroxy-2-oxoheptanedioate aldolase